MYETLKPNGSNYFELTHKRKYQIELKDLPYCEFECNDDVIVGVQNKFYRTS